MLKRFSALILALVIAAGAMCGCSKKVEKKDSSALDSAAAASSQAADDSAAEASADAPDAKLVIDGKEMDTDGLVMYTIDGRDVDFDTFRYYFYYTVNQITQSYGATLETIKDTEGGYDALLENTITNIKQE
ncbi:MAG: hypothetical protein IJ723_02350, partial [Ruminococcus sp.]|nr:hypothetical protein [Ruminococcus sp.]